MLHKHQQVKCGSHRMDVRLFTLFKTSVTMYCCRSVWPRGIRRGSEVVRLLELRARILPGAWMSVCCECCVLSGRGLRVGLIPRPERSYPSVVFLSEMFLSSNLIFEHFSKTCQDKSIFIKIGQEYRVPYMKINRHFCYLDQIFLEWDMFQTKVVQKIKTHFLFSKFFF
jgi:hypothetical protein